MAGRLERTMSDHLGLHLSNPVHLGGLARGPEVIPWGSIEASEAIKRICHGVTARCDQAIATHRSADAPMSRSVPRPNGQRYS